MQEEHGKWRDIKSVTAVPPLCYTEFSPTVRENAYVRVTGVIKNFGNKRYINATHVRPIKSANELYFHFLEAMTVRTFHERGNVRIPFLVLCTVLTRNFAISRPSLVKRIRSKTMLASTEDLPRLHTLALQPRDHHPPAVVSTTVICRHSSRRLSSASWLSRDVRRVSTLRQSLVGFGKKLRRSGTSSLPPLLSGNLADVDEWGCSAALDSLMDEGFVFSTIDESHFNVAF